MRALPFYPDIIFIYIYSLYMHTYILIYDHINTIKYKHIFVYIPIGSMYGIFTYIWLIFMVNVGKYTSPMDPMGYIYMELLIK